MSLLELADRCERARLTKQRMILQEAFRRIFGRPDPIWVTDDVRKHTSEQKRYSSFWRMLEAEAYESAAMLLIPDGWFTFLAGEDRHSRNWIWHLRGGFGFNAKCRASAPALALTAAALRAHAILNVTKGD